MYLAVEVRVHILLITWLIKNLILKTKPDPAQLKERTEVSVRPSDSKIKQFFSIWVRLHPRCAPPPLPPPAPGSVLPLLPAAAALRTRASASVRVCNRDPVGP